eukprot:symbB.v1.2.036367.t1/scaffold5055.1/size50094/2
MMVHPNCTCRQPSGNKELAYALICSVYGIGKTTAFKICVDTALDPHKTVAELSEEEEFRLTEEIGKYVLENPLRRMYKACAS